MSMLNGILEGSGWLSQQWDEHFGEGMPVRYRPVGRIIVMMQREGGKEMQFDTISRSQLRKHLAQPTVESPIGPIKGEYLVSDLEKMLVLADAMEEAGVPLDGLRRRR